MCIRDRRRIGLSGRSIVPMLIGFGCTVPGVMAVSYTHLVDYANQLRMGGMERRAALTATGKTRMRPILMTTLTTVLALSLIHISKVAATRGGMSSRLPMGVATM